MIRNLTGYSHQVWHQFSLVRYAGVHVRLGILNYAIAALLYGVVGVNHHISALVGHAVHVSLGFFMDRRESFRSMETTLAYGIPRYWFIEAISYASVVATMYIMIDLWQMNAYLSRGVVAMSIATALSFGLNYAWTFKYKT